MPHDAEHVETNAKQGREDVWGDRLLLFYTGWSAKVTLKCKTRQKYGFQGKVFWITGMTNAEAWRHV